MTQQDTERQTRSVFAEEADEVFAAYEVELSFDGKLMGGVPRDEKTIEGWIRAKTGLEYEDEVKKLVQRTLAERGQPLSAGMGYEGVEELAEEIAATQQTNGFKRDEHGLYVEDRQVKAMLKESTNVFFAGERWGKTRKGPRSYVAERVFVKPPRIYLGREEADGVELVIGHVSDAAGKRSTLAYHEYVEEPVLQMRIEVLEDCITAKQWAKIWLHAQNNGFGALRSQSHGRFEVTRFERVV